MTGEELKALRLRLKLSQTEFGKLIGIGWRMVCYIENGHRKLSKASAILAEKLRDSPVP